MPEFLPEELNLIYLYDPGNLHGLIYELRSMMAVLMPDENELRNLAQGVTGQPSPPRNTYEYFSPIQLGLQSI